MAARYVLADIGQVGNPSEAGTHGPWPPDDQQQPTALLQISGLRTTVSPTKPPPVRY